MGWIKVKGYKKTILLLSGVVCMVLGSATVIFAKNSAAAAEQAVKVQETMPVNPYMAVLATLVVGAIGAAVFIKRNRTNK